MFLKKNRTIKLNIYAEKVLKDQPIVVIKIVHVSDKMGKNAQISTEKFNVNIIIALTQELDRRKEFIAGILIKIRILPKFQA